MFVYVKRNPMREIDQQRREEKKREKQRHVTKLKYCSNEQTSAEQMHFN